MSVQLDKAAVIAKNNSAIAACDATIQRLESVVGLPVSMEAIRIAQLSRAHNERIQLNQLNAHLKAAGSMVKPMDDGVANELNALGNKLDQQIANNAINDASIAFITSVLDDVIKLRGIANAHTG